MTFYQNSCHCRNLKINGNCPLAVHLFSKFLTCNFLHCVSLPAAFTLRRTLLSEFIIFRVTKSISPSWGFFSMSFSLTLHLPLLFPSHLSTDHLIFLFLDSNVFALFCVLISTQIQRQNSQVCLFVWGDTNSCHPGKNWIYWSSQWGVLVTFWNAVLFHLSVFSPRFHICDLSRSIKQSVGMH